MLIQNSAKKWFEEQGSNAGNIMRAGLKRYKVYPSSMVNGINIIAQEKPDFKTLKELHQIVFKKALELDSKDRLNGDFIEPDLLSDKLEILKKELDDRLKDIVRTARLQEKRLFELANPVKKQNWLVRFWNYTRIIR